MLKRHTMVVGPFQCNCTVLVDEKSGDALVIDPGDDFDRIRAVCEKAGAKVKFAIHTHGHLDHIAASAELKRWSPETRLMIHRDDESLFKSLPMQAQMFGLSYGAPPAIDDYLEDGQTLKIGETPFTVLHTPGHSPGGVCLSFSAGAIIAEPVVFSGDTLFQLSIGRTDLWGGDHQQLLSSIKNRLLTLDKDTRVFSGHGPATTIGAEAAQNPFL